MSGFVTPKSGIAASVYLALFSLLLPFLTYLVIRRGWKNIITFLWFFSLFRFGSQLCGVVYAKIGPEHWQWLIAYLVLGAEGYFTLIYASFRFTCRAQVDAFGRSWILEDGPKIRTFFIRKHTWKGIFHMILIPANALVISGGSMLAGIDPDKLSSSSSEVTTSKALRTVGQVLFLLMTIAAIGLNAYVIRREKIRTPLTYSISAAAPFLLVRGIFGILSIYIEEMNYFSMKNYNDDGIDAHLVIFEYVLGTTMEFVASVIMAIGYLSLKPKPAQEEMAFTKDSESVQT